MNNHISQEGQAALEVARELLDAYGKRPQTQLELKMPESPLVGGSLFAGGLADLRVLLDVSPFAGVGDLPRASADEDRHQLEQVLASWWEAFYEALDRLLEPEYDAFEGLPKILRRPVSDFIRAYAEYTEAVAMLLCEEDLERYEGSACDSYGIRCKMLFGRLKTLSREFDAAAELLRESGATKLA